MEERFVLVFFPVVRKGFAEVSLVGYRLQCVGMLGLFLFMSLIDSCVYPDLQLVNQVYLVNGVDGQNVIARQVRREREWPAIAIRTTSLIVSTQVRLRLRHGHVHHHAVSHSHRYERKRLGAIAKVAEDR